MMRLCSSLLVLFCCIYSVLSNLNSVSIQPLNRNSKDLLTKSDFVFGKDRELFHASVDLKWLFSTISSKHTWLALVLSVVENIKRLNNDYDSLIKYRETASDILLKLRYHNRDNELRIYQNSLASSMSFALTKRRLVVYYIEENTLNPSIETSEYRHALADSTIGSMLNDKFIFMASTDDHPFASQVLQAVSDYEDRSSMLTSLDNFNDMSSFGRYRNQDRIAFRNGKPISAPLPRFPLIVVMAPVPPAPLGRFMLGGLFAKKGEFAVVGVSSLKRGDIHSASVAAFLRTVAKEHGSRVYDATSPESTLFRFDNIQPPGV